MDEGAEEECEEGTAEDCVGLLILPCFQKVQSCRRTDSSSLLHKYCMGLVS